MNLWCMIYFLWDTVLRINIAFRINASVKIYFWIHVLTYETLCDIFFTDIHAIHHETVWKIASHVISYLNDIIWPYHIKMTSLVISYRQRTNSSRSSFRVTIINFPNLHIFTQAGNEAGWRDVWGTVHTVVYQKYVYPIVVILPQHGL